MSHNTPLGKVKNLFVGKSEVPNRTLMSETPPPPSGSITQQSTSPISHRTRSHIINNQVTYPTTESEEDHTVSFPIQEDENQPTIELQSPQASTDSDTTFAGPDTPRPEDLTPLTGSLQTPLTDTLSSEYWDEADPLFTMEESTRKNDLEEEDREYRVKWKAQREKSWAEQYTKDEREMNLRRDKVRDQAFQNPEARTIPDVQDSDDEDQTPAGTDAGVMKALAQTMAEGMAISSREPLRVGDCDGTKPERVLQWLRALDDSPAPAKVARMTAQGPLARFLKENHDQPWGNQRRAIQEKFISPSFKQKQEDALGNLKQRSGETLTAYNHAFSQVVREAFERLPADQERLIRLYLRGLEDTTMARRAHKRKHKTLEAVMKEVEEDNASGDFLRPITGRGKVSAINEENETIFTDILKGMKTTAETVDKLQGQVAQMQANQPTRYRPAYNQTGPQVPATSLCYRCGKLGHFARGCRSNPQQIRTTTQDKTPSHDTLKCERCRREGHIRKDCKTGPPSRPCYNCQGNHWLFDCHKPRQQKPGN